MRWAVEAISGYEDGWLDPQSLATCAEVAQILKNFLEKQEVSPKMEPQAARREMGCLGLSI